MQTIGVRFTHGELTLEQAAEAGLPRVRIARRRLPVPRHRRDRTGRRRSAWHVAGALRAGAVRASRSGSTWPAAPPSRSSAWRSAGSRCVDILTDAAIAERDGDACRLRRIDQPRPARARDRPRRRPAPAWRSRLGAGRPPGPENRGRAAERPAQPSDSGSISCRRRPRGHAAPPSRRSARHQCAHRERADAGRTARRLGGFGTARPAPRPAQIATGRECGRRDHVAIDGGRAAG